jgi:outer membrane immunogenic protein
MWSRNHLILRTLLPNLVITLRSSAGIPQSGSRKALAIKRHVKGDTNMKRQFTMLAAAITFAALPTFAFAADTIDEIPSAPEAPIEEAAPVSNWSGAYAGVSGGYAWGKATAPGNKFSTKGLYGGVYGGYNLQQDGIVYGGEVDLGYSAAKGSNAGVAFKNGINGAARARLGVDAGPALIYGAGGVAFTKGKVTAGGVSDTKTHVGWTAGVGAEAKVTEAIIGRLEFRHNSYGSKTYAIGAGTPAKLSENEIRIGLGMKF